MAMFAGWERVDESWEIGDPGILRTGEWMFSVAETFLAFITINTHTGYDKVLFLGANPTLIYGEPSQDLPPAEIDDFINFFIHLFPGRTQHIKTFFRTYAVKPDAIEPTYVSPQQTGADLLIELCHVLSIEVPKQVQI